MQTHIIEIPGELHPDSSKLIAAEIEGALQAITTCDTTFIINDTLWYSQVQKSAKPTVVNSAKFITSKLKKELIARGWTPEKNIDDQTIDGYKTYTTKGGYKLSKDSLLDIVRASWDDNSGDRLAALFAYLFRRYVVRDCFAASSQFEKHFLFFEQRSTPLELRVGLEFETGNIASSFRALSKLDTLFKSNRIDLGVFITSLDKKSTAARIWPVSNRNGSFEELKNRNYRMNVEIPLIAIAFSPDGFSKNADYLGANGQTFCPRPTKKTITLQGVKYQVYLDSDERTILLPA